MDNLVEHQIKSCELNLVPLQDLDGPGFKLISSKEDSKTPNIQTANIIFNILLRWAFNSSRGIRK